MTGPGRRRGGGEHLLGEALESYLRAQGHEGALSLAGLEAAWAGIVGPEVAAHSTPAALRGTTLVVAVDQQAFATQLGFLSEQLLARLAEHLGPGRVDRLEATVRPGRGLQ